MTKENSRVKNSINNILTGFGYQLLMQLLGFVSRTVFIYCLGQTYLGVNGLFSNVLSFLSFAELGIGQAIVFSLYKPIADWDEEQMLSLMKLYEKIYRILFFIVLGLGVALLPFLPYFINDFDAIKDLNVIYLMYLFSTASTYLFAYKSSFLSACQKGYMVTISNAVFSVLGTIIQMIILLVFKNFILYLAVQIAISILQNYYIAHKVDNLNPFLKRKDAKPLKSEDLKKIKKDVGALILYKLGMMSLYSTDNILISKFAGLIIVGLYSNYLMISNSISGILGSIFANISASIGNLNASDDNEHKYRMFKVINFVVFWLYSYAAICIYVLISPFIGSIWLNGEYILDNNVVFITCLNLYIVAMLYAPTQYRQTLGLISKGKYRPLASAVVNLVTSIILGKYFGLTGILWGTAITRLSISTWYDPYLVCGKLGKNVWKYYADYTSKILLMLAVGALCSWIISFFTIDNLLKWILSAIILSIFINLVYYTLYHRTEEYKYIKDVVVRLASNVISKLTRKIIPSPTA